MPRHAPTDHDGELATANAVDDPPPPQPEPDVSRHGYTSCNAHLQLY